MTIWITGAHGMLGTDLSTLARRQFAQIDTVISEELPQTLSHKTSSSSETTANRLNLHKNLVRPCRLVVSDDLLTSSSETTILETDRETDITDSAVVSDFIEKNKPDIIINCAAYTAVDNAESEKELNYKLNCTGIKNLGECSAQAGIPIIHISTDYVLNGSEPNQLRETDPINPQNEYGRAKAEGELALAKSNPKHIIVRTAWLYGINGKNFVKSMLNLMRTKEKISVVGDQLGNPTWTFDLSRALLKIAHQLTSQQINLYQLNSPQPQQLNPQQPQYGIYHFSGDGITSWHGFAVEIQKQAIAKGLLQKSIEIAAIPSSEWKSPANRPLWSALDKTKIKNNFGVEVPAWQTSLSQYLDLELAATQPHSTIPNHTL
ncbi:hypothetical protein AGMMS49938_15090 [Fibrobacterales bacterium]|nr:hypothetical protein AGMMS49938_15090 [Fibrobacterales bacterium]